MTPSGRDPLLVVLTGPVGCGKSTTALRVAEQLRAPNAGHSGIQAALVDLDLVADMLGRRGTRGGVDPWQAARRVCGALAGALYAEGCDVVIVEGEFFTPAELASLVSALTMETDVRLFALDVSYEVCRARVNADPSPDRNLSRDPAFLRRMSAQFHAALPWLSTIGSVLDANAANAGELAEVIISMLELPEGG